MTAGKAAFLIDADNISADGMVRALAHLRERAFEVCVLRAYGSFESLGTAREFLLRESVRSIVNQGRSTTDAALVVDAMDLLHAGDLPQVVAIGSGDADFAPLVVRLRETGRRVVCYAQKSKAAEGLERFYAEVIHVDGAAASDPPASPESPANTKKTASRKVATRKAVKAPAAKPVKTVAPARLSVSDEVRRVLNSFAGFGKGADVELNAVVHKLRELGLMSKRANAKKFFAQHAPDVNLTPLSQPNKLHSNARS